MSTPSQLTATEIASQPSCWRRAVALAPAVADALPRRGERVAVIGCGTGANLARAYAELRERAGAGETDAFAASEVLDRRYDRVLAISRSGQTSEVLEALDTFAPGTPRVAVTADVAAPLAAAADEVVDLGFADEQSVVETRFATSVLVLLRCHLGEDGASLVAACEPGLAAPLPAGAPGCQELHLLGWHWTVALAEEAALKLSEMAQVVAEPWSAMEYRHGPISRAEPGVLVWCLGSAPGGLREEVLATGAGFEVTPPGLDPIGDLVRAQRLGLALAAQRDLDTDRPRHLSRAVVLDGR